MILGLFCSKSWQLAMLNLASLEGATVTFVSHLLLVSAVLEWPRNVEQNAVARVGASKRGECIHSR
jgi:hypothetical protein